MRICGVSLDSSGATVVVVDADEAGNVIVHETEIRKIPLTNHEDASALQDFAQTWASFLRDHSIGEIALRRCTYKGKYTSGAAAIKMEALLQLCAVSVELLSPQTINAVRRKLDATLPDGLKNYQQEAFRAALAKAQPRQ